MTISMIRRQGIVLASASPRRQEILQGLGLLFLVDPSRIPEPGPRSGEPPPRFAVRTARAKALAVASKHLSGLVVAADTIVIVRNRILGKPASDEEAGDMLRSLSGRWHEVITGLCIVDCKSGRTRCSHTTSRVHFRRLTQDEITWYLRTGEHRDKAGAYAIQGHASLFIDRIEGCYFNIVGFPVSAFERLCRQLGVSLLELVLRSRVTRKGVRSQESGVRII